MFWYHLSNKYIISFFFLDFDILISFEYKSLLQARRQIKLSQSSPLEIQANS